ncbi:hypothetical protein V7S43_018960 [Phytophthora oleae]|uniref:RNase H type-1 domain-containing protein n=1 Tax=Phytophthora oleae TaxID=2107226 RepID=A0ABD3EPB6_9STRA
MALERGIQKLMVVGDSRIAIQQAQGLINCNQPNLEQRLAEFESLKTKFRSLGLVHVKREYNQAVDYLTSKTLALGDSWRVEDADEFTHLQLVSKIHEKLMKPQEVQKSETLKSENLIVTSEIETPGPESAPLPHSAKVFAAVTRAQAREDAEPPEDDEEREPAGPLVF